MEGTGGEGGGQGGRPQREWEASRATRRGRLKRIREGGAAPRERTPHRRAETQERDRAETARRKTRARGARSAKARFRPPPNGMRLAGCSEAGSEVGWATEARAASLASKRPRAGTRTDREDHRAVESASREQSLGRRAASGPDRQVFVPGHDAGGRKKCRKGDKRSEELSGRGRPRVGERGEDAERKKSGGVYEGGDQPKAAAESGKKLRARDREEESKMAASGEQGQRVDRKRRNATGGRGPRGADRRTSGSVEKVGGGGGTCVPTGRGKSPAAREPDAEHSPLPVAPRPLQSAENAKTDETDQRRRKQRKKSASRRARRVAAERVAQRQQGRTG